MLEAEEVLSAVIFCNRKTTVRELNKSLQRHGFRSGEIHGDIDQSARIAELERFRAGTVNILVASDVAARGLDIKGVSHVFNFAAPWHPDDYRSEERTSELQSLMRISYAAFCLKKNT